MQGSCDSRDNQKKGPETTVNQAARIESESDLIGYRNSVLGMLVASRPRPELEKVLAASRKRKATCG
ncbi:hypothetical protein SCOR_22620 [Sulfidibacter corallicola]